MRCPSLLLLPLLAAGCCAPPPPEHLPAYSWTNDAAALATLCQRSTAVRTVSCECVLTLTRSDGQTVRLDGAVVMQVPGMVRMRAWKFGQAVFDLTLTPAGLWVEGPKDSSRRDEVLPASLDAAKMARAWSIVSGQFFCAADARVEDHGGARWFVERSIDGQRVRCAVDRATLTPRAYTVLDSQGIVRFSLAMDRYGMINGIPLAQHLTARSDGGTIDIVLKDPELNGEPAPNAFVPPRTAVKMP